MKHVLYTIAISTLSLGLFQACSNMDRYSASREPDGRANSATPVYGEPGVDYPSPFYVGERNSRIGRPGFRDEMRQKSAAADDNYNPDFEDSDINSRDRDYVIGGQTPDWNRERKLGKTTSRERVTRNRTERRTVVNKEPVDEMFGEVDTYPADKSVNVANLADVELISRFHLANQREIELGRLAEERAENPHVRALGRRIAMDHQFADRRLMNLTRRLELNVPMQGTANPSPTAPVALDTTGLENLSGSDFDREIVRRIHSAHAEKVAMLQDAERQLPADSRLRQLVTSLIPIMEQHRDVASNVSSKYLEQNI